VSFGPSYAPKTERRLKQFVEYIRDQRKNLNGNKIIKRAAFITFNGDLHNGGSPAGFRHETIPHTYHRAGGIFPNYLKQLPIPIFLTTGNHDGQVLNAVPKTFRVIDDWKYWARGILKNVFGYKGQFFWKIEDEVERSGPRTWPNYDRQKFVQYLD